MIAPGPFAPTVTQWVAGTPTVDAGNNEVSTFPTSLAVKALAEYPGGQGSSRPTSTEVNNEVTADRVLLFPGGTSVAAADEFTCSDGLRYRVQGVAGEYLNPMTGTAVTQVNLRRIT